MPVPTINNHKNVDTCHMGNHMNSMLVQIFQEFDIFHAWERHKDEEANNFITHRSQSTARSKSNQNEINCQNLRSSSNHMHFPPLYVRFVSRKSKNSPKFQQNVT